MPGEARPHLLVRLVAAAVVRGLLVVTALGQQVAHLRQLVVALLAGAAALGSAVLPAAVELQVVAAWTHLGWLAQAAAVTQQGQMEVLPAVAAAVAVGLLAGCGAALALAWALAHLAHLALPREMVGIELPLVEALLWVTVVAGWVQALELA